MYKILFICGNGISSGMIASKTAKAGISLGYDVEWDSYSYTQLEEVIDYFDIVLVAPQIKFNEPMIKEICLEHDKPYILVDSLAYALLNGEEIFNKVLEKMGKENKNEKNN